MALPPPPPPPPGLDLTEDRGPIILGLSVSTYSLAVIAVALRFWCRRLKGVKLWLDDWLILACLVPQAGQVFTTGVYAVKRGLGKHIWATPPDGLYVWAICLWVAVQTYITAMTLVKLSILAFFWRSFNVRKSFRAYIWILAIIVILWYLSGIITGICQCFPVRAFWERFHPTHPMDPSQYYCGINNASLYFWHAVPTFITDVLMLILPIPYILTLQLPRSQKIALASIFLIGTFVTVASIIRIIYLHDDDMESPDVTWNFFGVGIWSIIELNIAIICACLPFLRPVLVKCSFGLLTPSTMRSQTHHTTNTKASSTTHPWDIDRRFGTTTTQVRALGRNGANKVASLEPDEHPFVQLGDEYGNSERSLPITKKSDSGEIELREIEPSVVEGRESPMDGIVITREVQSNSNSLKDI